MLETIEGMTLCGVRDWNGDWEDIYCDSYGVLAFETYADGGCWTLTEINIGAPMAQETTDSLRRNIDSGLYGQCIGVIYGYEGNIVVLLDEERAVERRLWAPKEDVGEVFFYNSDEDYDVEELDAD